MDKVHLNIGDIKITFLNAKGDPWEEGDDPIHKHLFIIEGPGIDPNRVASVTIPTLSYGDHGLLTVQVEMRPCGVHIRSEV